MSLRTFIADKDKVLVDPGTWSDKRMPKTGGKFPLSKNRSYRVGAPGWRWRVAIVESGGQTYRLLMMYHAAKQNYVAYLGLVAGSDTLVIGKLEFHSTHPGWHVHGCCKPPDLLHAGKLNYPEMVRYPNGNSRHRRATFGIDCDVAAAETAASYFHVPGLSGDDEAQSEFTLI